MMIINEINGVWLLQNVTKEQDDHKRRVAVLEGAFVTCASHIHLIKHMPDL